MFGWLNHNIVYLGLVSLFSDFGSEMATSVLPAFLISIGASASALGIIEGIANASNAFMSIVAGYASDYTHRRKPFAALGYLFASLGISLLSLASTVSVVLFGRIITRMGKGMRDPARDALLVSSAQPNTYGKVFGFHRSMDTLGAIIGPLTALFLIKNVSFPVIFLIAFIPVLFSFIIMVTRVKEAYVSKQAKHFKKQHFLDLPHIFKKYLVAVGVFSLGNCAVSLLILRAIELLKPTLGISNADWYSILLYILFNIFYAFFSYPVGYAADVVGKKTVLLIGYLLTLISLIGFAVSYSALWYIFILFIIAGLAYAIVDGVQRAMAAELMPFHVHGTGYGILTAIIGLSSLFANAVIGLLWTYQGAPIGFGLAALFCGVGALLLLRVRSNNACI